MGKNVRDLIKRGWRYFPVFWSFFGGLEGQIQNHLKLICYVSKNLYALVNAKGWFALVDRLPEGMLLMCWSLDKLILKWCVFESKLQNQCSHSGSTDYDCLTDVRSHSLPMKRIVNCHELYAYVWHINTLP